MRPCATFCLCVGWRRRILYFPMVPLQETAAFPLPSIGADPSEIAARVLELLLRLLPIEVAYARLVDSRSRQPIEVARGRSSDVANRAREIGVALAPALERGRTPPATLSDAALGGELRIAASGVGFSDGWCTAGKLTWISGDNTGLSVEIKVHRAINGTDEFDLWQRAPQAIKIGDTFRVMAGCDKTHATCRAKFKNTVNFRGFPHMPGNDFIIRMPQQGEPGLDGGSFFR